jgi:hypothetical protein
MDKVKNNNAVSTDKPEAVDHPAHYQGKHECIEVMRALFGDRAVADFCRCNSYKYRFRADGKGGAEDIRKAEWYEDYLMKMNVGDPIDADDPTNAMVAASVDAYRKMSDGLDELRGQVSAGLEEFFEKIMKNMDDAPKPLHEDKEFYKSMCGDMSDADIPLLAEIDANSNAPGYTSEQHVNGATGEIKPMFGDRGGGMKGAAAAPRFIESSQIVAVEGSIVRITWDNGKEFKPDGYGISGVSTYPHHGEEMCLENCRRFAAQRGWRSGTITVSVEYPSEGKIYRYGNHGYFWEEIGTICGYA